MENPPAITRFGLSVIAMAFMPYFLFSLSYVLSLWLNTGWDFVVMTTFFGIPFTIVFMIIGMLGRKSKDASMTIGVLGGNLHIIFYMHMLTVKSALQFGLDPVMDLVAIDLFVGMMVCGIAALLAKDNA